MITRGMLCAVVMLGLCSSLAGCVAGGDVDEELDPEVTADSSAAASSSCERYFSTKVASERYVVQNNRWNDAGGSQCISVNGTSFSVTASHDLPTNGAPAGYASIYSGCHYGNCTTGWTMKRVSQLQSVQSRWAAETPANGTYNASYDIWFDPTERRDGANTGAELMIWVDKQGAIQPIGQKMAVANLAGRSWDVWIGRGFSGANVISYVARSLPGASFNVNLNIMSFIRDAGARGQLQDSWYLTSVQAGFEIWKGGSGFKTNSFGATVR
jgi:Glycosyl hydrolase family 12